jgi:malate dehydrogenase
MARPKITIAGAGNVGATAAHIIAASELADAMLIDVVEGLAEGKALDIAQAGPIELSDSRVTGTTNWEEAAGSNIVIVTSGMRRSPGMSRDDLLTRNVGIIRQVGGEIRRHCRDAIVIVVANPLDAMVHAMAAVTDMPRERVMGMAGELDFARFSYFLASELNLSAGGIRGVILGGHGDDMLPLPRHTNVRGLPITELLDQEKIDRIVERTRKGGIEIVNLLGYSAYYAPAAGAVKMAEAIIEDKKELLSCCAYCRRQYRVGGYFVGVPVILGRGGVERIVELELNDSERRQFEKSVSHVRELAARVDSLLAAPPPDHSGQDG